MQQEPGSHIQTTSSHSRHQHHNPIATPDLPHTPADHVRSTHKPNLYLQYLEKFIIHRTNTTIMSLSSLLAPITIPLASFLAIPMLSSWSTSLNLIFLSVAWTTIAASYSPLQLELFAPFVLRISLYIIPSFIFLLFDIGLPSLATEFKSQGDWAIPGRQKGGYAKVRRVIAWSCANVLLAVAIQAAIEFLVTDVFRMKSLLLIKGSRWGLNHLPNPWTMIKHGLIGLLSRNVSFPHYTSPSILTKLGHPILHPHTSSAFSNRRCPCRLASIMAPQHQNPIFLRRELRPPSLPSAAPLPPPLFASHRSTHAHPDLPHPHRYFQS